VRAGILLQARFASNRLPGKALEPVGGRPLVEQCLLRLLASECGPVILATTRREDDDAVAAVATRVGVRVFRGATDDVLERFVRCAEQERLDIVIRATGDNPAVDIEAPGRLLHAMRRTGAEYVLEEQMPHGGGVEAITLDALKRQALLGRDSFDREHVTTYVRRHRDQFDVLTLTAPVILARPDVRVTVDTPADLEQMRRLYARVGGSLAPLSDFIDAWDHLERRSVA
jgi:spore coat polysaccharide biosynthesis protein SpsF (cytidylyltransferase family)